jgi:hypothetical protein
VWLRKLLLVLFSVELEPTVIHRDNRSFVNLSKIPVFHDISKHTEMRYHYVQDIVQKNIPSIQYVPMTEHTSDILTKPLSLTKFVYFQDKLGVAENGFLVEREC